MLSGGARTEVGGKVWGNAIILDILDILDWVDVYNEHCILYGLLYTKDIRDS